MFGGVYARSAQVVGTKQQKHLLRLSCSYSLNVIKRLIGDSARHTTVHNVVVVKGLPPLMHIGDTVAYKHNLFRVYRQNLERVVPMITERAVGHSKRRCQQPT